MNFKPTDKTIKELLSSGSQFTIPRFQREYSWDKANYVEFYQDILKGIRYENGSLTTSPYFLGTMLFLGDYNEPQKNVIEVIDGQQRLTTITILFSAISDYFTKLESEILSERLFEYIMTTDDNGEPIRILKSKTHYPFFSYYIQNRKKLTKEEPITEEEQCIKETYEYLFNALEEKMIKSKLKLEDIDAISHQELLKAIRDQVLNCTFISISVNERKQVQEIFEILNGKGKKLADVEFIKNNIFDKLNCTEPVDFAEDKWNKIKRNLNENPESIGIETFFYHFFNSQFGMTRKKALYEKFKVRIEKKKDGSVEERYENFLVQAEIASKLYIQIIQPNRQHYANRKEYYWLPQSLNVLSNYFGIVQVRVALLALLQLKNDDMISHKRLKTTVLFLESFHFVYNALCKRGPNKVESIYSSFSAAVRKAHSKKQVSELIEKKLVSPLNLLMPSYTDYEKSFLELSYSKGDHSSNVITKYVLNTISSSINSTDCFNDNFTVEHIIPENKDNMTLNIGNLIMLEGNLNEKAADSEYLKKKDVYKLSSSKEAIKLIQEYSDWNKATITKRAKNLAFLYYEKRIKID